VGEFDLIARFFERPAPAASAAQVARGVGDDCALLQPTPGMQWAVSTDMLVEGRHFLSTVAPERLGHKALAVNLSDLAACGARPVAYTLALSLPSVQEAWLAGFAQGLHALADAHGIALVGGDTTAGPLVIGITVMGEVPPGQALLRSGARAGDDLWVSGHLGDARLALEAFRGTVSPPQRVMELARRRMEQPVARVALGLALRGVASAAADVSDGLCGDLGHILAASQVGAVIEADDAMQLIASKALWMGVEGTFDDGPTPDDAQWVQWVLHGGDDYELVFTAAPAWRSRVGEAAALSGTPVRRIGQIQAEPGLWLRDTNGVLTRLPTRGFDHFA
jgi:thiamine-monophosphate kinase